MTTCPACGEERQRRGPCGWCGDDGSNVARAGMRGRMRPQDGLEGAGDVRGNVRRGCDARKGRQNDSGGKHGRRWV